eukprot:TRINITY_DN5443_c0_g1_i1.p1 TRINITY_DN5443_c0_g1~~TRINITY_DN5443_c0_g1_i1.p1  ORF type:complete len:165 (-),score=33.86 TRINITY_DN5443_c0_g1_i1:87-542(-)
MCIRDRQLTKEVKNENQKQKKIEMEFQKNLDNLEKHLKQQISQYFQDRQEKEMVRFEEFISKIQFLENQIYPTIEQNDQQSIEIINQQTQLLKKVYIDLQEEIQLLNSIAPKIQEQFDQQIDELHQLLSVSYTHLTLPTKRIVQISVVARP